MYKWKKDTKLKFDKIDAIEDYKSVNGKHVCIHHSVNGIHY